MLLDFFRCLNICHDVVIKKQSNEFSGSSQDETTFLETSRSTKFAEYMGRTSHTIDIRLNGQDECYEFLKIIEFSSDRKKMSVIVRRKSDNRVFNFVKGADSVMMKSAVDASTKSEELVKSVNYMAS